MSSKRASIQLSVTVLTVLMVMTAAVIAGAGDSDALPSEGVTDVSMQIITNGSDYSGLAYLSDSLPDALSASEWIQGTDGLWYNINTTSAQYGRILTYGMVTGITDAEVESDVIAHFDEFTADFLILQINYRLNHGCAVSVNVSKDGVSKYASQTDEVTSVTGYDMADGMDKISVLSVKTSGADINVDPVRGEYTVEVAYNGISAGTVSQDYLGSKLQIAGKVTDADAKAVPGATVAFADGAVTTDALGNYSKYVDYGSVPTINSITAAGYTFAGLPYVCGTVTSDLNDLDFTAEEQTLKVIVLDGSGRPASGVNVKAQWYSSSGTGPYDIEVSTEGITVAGMSDSTGAVRITLAEIKAGAKLYISGIDGTNYTFSVDPMPSPPTSSNPVPNTLDEAGNAYANIATLADVTIATVEKSAEITVTGAKDTSLEGGAALPYVNVSAVWYYQVENTGEYTISLEADIGAGTFVNLKPGTVRFNSSYTNTEGKVIVTYKEPEWDAVAGETAHLYMYVSGADSTSGSSEFVFTKATIVDGDTSIEGLTAATSGSKALPKGSIVDTALISDDVAYTVTGTITGTVPDHVSAYRLTSGNRADTKVATASAGTIAFAFPIKAGTSNTVRIEGESGYSFTKTVETLPSADGDQVFSSVASYDAPAISRHPVSLLATYTVDSVSSDDTVTAVFTVTGTTVTSVMDSDVDTITLKVYGRAGNVIDSISITGNGDLYVSPIQGYTATGHRITESKIVTYINPDADTPTKENVSANNTLQVICDGSVYATVTTDVDGLATASLPELAILTFKVGDLTASAQEVAAGPYTGYIAINLSGVVQPVAPTEINLTIRYMASSSMQNTQPPTNVDVLDSPIHNTYAIGSTQILRAPELNGFTFSGWLLDGQMVSDTRDVRLCTLAITADMDGSTLVGSYSADDPEQPKPDYGTVIAIGALAVTLSIIALMFMIFQMRRY